MLIIRNAAVTLRRPS